jgi:uncharacterized protein (DUF1697 family)
VALRRDLTLPAHVALLRGVNLGGKNKLAMKDLVSLFTEAGCHNVRTYIQSGNIIFNAAPKITARLPESIPAQIKKCFDCRTQIILRTGEELRDVVQHNPFVEAGAAEETLHTVFLADLPVSSNTHVLDPHRSPPDEFVVRGREVYLRLPHGAARTKLTNSYFDSKLGTASTIRNWRTVLKLLELVETKTR